MSESLMPAVAVLPGQILERELESRGWSQKDLATIMGRPPQAINEIINGNKQITPDTALELAQALGTSPELWINLEASYRLYLAKQQERDETIDRRSRLYNLAPIAEMIKRGWIENTDSIDALEKRVCAFFGISSPEETPRVAAALRDAKLRGPEINAQIAWVKRVEHLAASQKAGDYDRSDLKKEITRLLAFAAIPEDVSRVPTLLQKLGIRFVILPQLPKTYIDGATLVSDSKPVVGLSLRYDRIDAFWFTLMHELAHVLQKSSGVHLDRLYGGDGNGSAIEEEANTVARNWLIDQHQYRSFVRTTKPYFSKAKVEQFAQRIGRHPGIVVGRLHFDGLVDYKNLNTYLTKVSPFLKDWMAD